MIDVSKVRVLLESYYGGTENLPEELVDISDEELLKVNLTDFGLDSLDYINIVILAVKIENYDDIKFESSEFRREQTVANFIKLCNDMTS